MLEKIFKQKTNMAQISKGTTYTATGAGSLVTYLNLNAHVDNATLLAGSITDQTALAVNGVQSVDLCLIYDNSDGTLKKASISDLLNSNLNTTFNNVTISTDLSVGNIAEIDQIQSSGSGILLDDDVDIANNLVVTGSSTLTGNVIADNGFTSNGTANFTGVFQIGGTVSYALTEVIEEDIPNATGAAANTLHNLFTSASYTKPVGELWIVEVTGIVYQANDTLGHWRMTDSTDTIIYVSHYWNNDTSNDTIPIHFNFYLPSSNSHSGTFVFRFKSYQTNITISPSSSQLSSYPDSGKRTDGKFRIYKFKTA